MTRYRNKVKGSLVAATVDVKFWKKYYGFVHSQNIWFYNLVNSNAFKPQW